ncbi:CASP-like protein 4A3 [Andrographis paniculata]|uniref:CASP-like protein 4A3 n=1 Tax=Andrographis paniculata TaxID=175694 RepID=UPI0021E8DB9A|nr:CASP-like protein 4A3 [Andrographis paniculata]
MENPEHPRSKRTLRRNGNSNSNVSMSDETASPASQAESWHSAYRSDSPFRFSDSLSPSLPENDKNARTLVPYSPGKSNFPATSPAAAPRNWLPWPRSEKQHTFENTGGGGGGGGGGNGNRREKSGTDSAGKGNSPVVLGLNRLTREEPKKVEVGGVGLEEGYGGEGEADDGGGRAALRKAALMLRAFEMVTCLISFSVMAADKTQGWSGDSYDRYIEYRYCLGVNIIGFVYSGFQAMDGAWHLGKGRRRRKRRCHFDFSMDQILAYLEVSAASCAATRVTDWISNWGKDEFTMMATVSIAMSFLAFIAFASSSIISGYNLCSA